MVAQSDSTLSKKGAVLKRLVMMAGIFCLLFILLLLFMPNVEQTRGEARRSTSMHNLKQIGIALFDYHNKYQIFPPGGIQTAKGEPYHSWQTQLLPFIDDRVYINRGMEPVNIYQTIDFNKPWNDPAKKMLFQQKIPLYLNPEIYETISAEGYALSHYVGNELLLKKKPGFRIADIKDGASNTIMAMEIGENFKPWGDPTALANPVDVSGSGKKLAFSEASHVLMGDGRVISIPKDIDPTILKALSTPDGGEQVDGEF